MSDTLLRESCLDQNNFNLGKKSRGPLSREQERRLLLLWKRLFRSGTVIKFLSTRFEEHGICLRTIASLESLLGDLLFVWFFHQGDKGRKIPPPSKRSLGEIKAWVLRLEEVVFGVLRPYTYEMMQGWSFVEVNYFFHSLIKLY